MTVLTPTKNRMYVEMEFTVEREDAIAAIARSREPQHTNPDMVLFPSTGGIVASVTINFTGIWSISTALDEAEEIVHDLLDTILPTYTDLAPWRVTVVDHDRMEHNMLTTPVPPVAPVAPVVGD